jgi:hypothetical protein
VDKTAKNPKITGEAVATSVYKKRGQEDVATAGNKLIETEVSLDPATAEASGSIGVTVQTKQFESLRLDVAGRLPCSVSSFFNGAAHKQLFTFLRNELEELTASEKKRWMMR